MRATLANAVSLNTWGVVASALRGYDIVRKRLGELISDSATYGASSVLGKLIGFALLPVYTRYLTTEDYGVMAMLTILIALFPPLANLGMTNAIFRRFSFSQSDEERRTVLGTGLITVSAASVILYLGADAAAGILTEILIGGQAARNLVRLTLVTAALASIGAVPLVVLRAERRVRAAAGLNILKLVISITVTIWLVVFRAQGVLGVVIGSLVAETVVLVVNVWLTLRSFHPSFDPETWRAMFAYGIPFLPHRIQGVGLVYFGQYMVRHMLGLQDAGLYNIAIRIALPVTFVVGAVQKSWVPIKFQIHAEDADPEATFRSLTTFYFAGVSYLWVGVSVWGPEVVRVMTAPEFHDAAYLVAAIGLIPVSKGLYFMFGTGFEMGDDTRPLPLVSMFGLAAVVALAIALIPRMGAAGAAVATVGGWVLMARLVFTLAQRRFSVCYDWPTLLGFASVATGLVALGVVGQEWPIAIRIGYAVVASAVYPALVIWFMLRSPTERARVKGGLVWVHSTLRRFRGDSA